jgi:hypothetical protein
LLSVLALAILCTLMFWRHILTKAAWSGLLVALGFVAIIVWIKPQCSRTYYRFSTWAGFWSSQWVARIALAAIFAAFITPAGIFLRLFGKDALQLKRSANATTYWKQAKPSGSLDRLF